jgi:hypothetical protein
MSYVFLQIALVQKLKWQNARAPTVFGLEACTFP